MIKILQEGYYLIGNVKTCGDGCCSWNEWESTWCSKDEEYDEDRINMDDKKEGIDFIYTK